MSSRNVAIQVDVYRSLSKEKRPRESFTSLFRRLLEQRGSLEELSGAWGPGGAKRDRTALGRLRRSKATK